jgi:DNA-binding NarL/FixJ family response regulator
LRVLLATDRPHLGDALSLFLTERHIDVVAVASDVRELVVLALATHPCVVLVDWQLAGAGSAGILADLKSCEEPAPIIVMGTAEERVLAQMAAADGYVTLGDPPEALLEALREVAPTTGR